MHRVTIWKPKFCVPAKEFFMLCFGIVCIYTLYNLQTSNSIILMFVLFINSKQSCVTGYMSWWDTNFVLMKSVCFNGKRYKKSSQKCVNTCIGIWSNLETPFESGDVFAGFIKDVSGPCIIIYCTIVLFNNNSIKWVCRVCRSESSFQYNSELNWWRTKIKYIVKIINVLWENSNVRPAFFYTEHFVYYSVAMCLIMTKLWHHTV